MRARETVRTALAWRTLAAIFSRMSLGAGVARGAMSTHGTNVAFVALVAFDTLAALRTNQTLFADSALRAEKPTRTRQATRTHRANAALRSTSTVVALGAASAFLAFLAVRSGEAFGSHGSSSAGGTCSSRKSSRTLSAVDTVFARMSWVTGEADKAGFAWSTLVALGAHDSVSAGVAGDAGSAASSVHTVQAWRSHMTLVKILKQNASKKLNQNKNSLDCHPCHWRLSDRVRQANHQGHEDLQDQRRLANL